MRGTRPSRTAAALFALAGIAAAARAADSTAGVLAGAAGRIAGDLAPAPPRDGGTRDTLLWRSPRFTGPFELRLGEISGVTFDAPRAREPAQGPFVFLRGGDVLPATIDGLDADALAVTIAGPDGPQRLRIARSEVAAIARASGGGGSYEGPSGLAGWDQTPAGTWREEPGRISTDKVGARVVQDVGAPARARFDITLTRRRGGQFCIAVGAADKPERDGYEIQAVGGDAGGTVILVRRSGGRAVIEPLPAAWRNDQLRVVVFVDQERGRLAAILPEAEGEAAGVVTEATLPPGDKERPSGRFRLELTGGEIALDRLAVTAWRNADPTLRGDGETTIVTRDGGLEGSTVESFDAAAGEFVVRRGGDTKRLPIGDVEQIRFPEGDEPAGGCPMRVIRADGGTLAGELVKVDDRAVWLRRRGVDADVAVPRDAIASIRCQRTAPERDDAGGRVGTLVSGGDRLRGWLATGTDGGIGWRPLGGVAAATFADAPDAAVEYVDRPPEFPVGEQEVGGIGGMVTRDGEGFYAVAMMTEEGAAQRDGRIQPGDRIIAIAPSERARFVETRELDNEVVTHLLRGRIGSIVRLKVTDAAGGNPRQIDLPRGRISVQGREFLKQALEAHTRLAGPLAAADAAFPSLIVLRSGDVAPCKVEAVGADGLRIRSPLAGTAGAEAVTVPADLVKAVELVDMEGGNLDKTLFERLLTLPRMQRDRPPTHLLRLVDGDYLRGRLLGVDDQTVTFEVLDVVKKLPRGQVARLIWLHPEVPRHADGDADAEPEPRPEPAGLMVQGVSADDRRMTLVAKDVAGDTVRGSSAAFGDSSLDLGRVERLLIGAAIGRESRDLPFAQWTLRPAPEPRALAKPRR